jgi:hypothetical protein
MTLSSYLFQPNYRENKDEDDDDNEDILARERCITEGI